MPTTTSPATPTRIRRPSMVTMAVLFGVALAFLLLVLLAVPS